MTERYPMWPFSMFDVNNLVINWCAPPRVGGQKVYKLYLNLEELDFLGHRGLLETPAKVINDDQYMVSFRRESTRRPLTEALKARYKETC